MSTVDPPKIDLALQEFPMKTSDAAGTRHIFDASDSYRAAPAIGDSPEPNYRSHKTRNPMLKLWSAGVPAPRRAERQ